MTRTGWFAAAGQIVGSAYEWSTSYSWDGRVHASQDAAIRNGLRHFGHDDFNVGRVEDDHLVWWGWMHEEHPAEDRPDAAQALGLDGAR